MCLKFCPMCEQESNIKRVEKDIDYEYKGKKLTVRQVFRECPLCGEQFWLSSDGDWLERVDKKYHELFD